MAKRPVTFQPTLYTPEGLNNYTGVAFNCFTVGDTLPFEFTLNTDIDVTGYSIVIAMAPEFDSLIANGCEVTIPLTDATNKIFSGDIPNTVTKGLTPGIHKALAKFIDASSKEYIFDMCLLEVYPNIEFTLN